MSDEMVTRLTQDELAGAAAVAWKAEPAPATALDGADDEPYRVFGRRNVVLAIVLFFAALVSFTAMQKAFHIASTGVSNAPQYLYQAQSFLQGRFDLDLPSWVTDIVTLHGKSYIVYPPLPAVLLMPFVALFGLHTSDVLFTAVLSALNLPLLYLLLEQVRANGLTRRPRWENLLIAGLLYYGSINLWLSLGGRMWFTAHILCMTCSLLSLLLAFRRRFAWSAVLLGCAFFSRATAIFGFPFLLYLVWQDAGAGHELERFIASLRARAPDWGAVPWRRLAPPVLVIAGTGILFLVRNILVFGAPLETGYAILIHQRYPMVTQGPFCPCYVPANVVANFFTFPRITFSGPFGGAFDRHPVFDMLNNGLAVSVFVTTPLFLLLFWRNRRRDLMRAALWLTLGIIVVMVLLFHASGWYQFGARYLYDGYAYAFLLLALSDARVDWRFVALGVIGILINVLGAHQFWTSQLFQL